MRAWCVPALAGTVIAIAGCGGGSTSARSQVAIGSHVCPAQPVSVGADQIATPSVTALVARNPDAAVVCSYYTNGVPGRIAERFALSRLEARTLAWMLDTGASRVIGDALAEPYCDSLLAQNAIWLRYGTAIESVVVAGCAGDSAVAERGKTRFALSEFATDALDAMTGAPPRSSLTRLPPPRDSVRTPNYVGEQLGPAAAAVRRAGLGPGSAADEISDPEVPLGTVIWQEPFPGAIQERSQASVYLDVAVRQVPACRRDQLAGAFLSGGVGTGDLFGNIALLDVSAQACALSGPMTLTGLRRDGHPDTVSVSERLEPPVTLNPRASAAAIAQPASSLIAEFGFADDVRDDPTAPNGLCSSFRYPATWSVTIGHSPPLLVPNRDPSAAAEPGHGRFYSCRGGLSTTPAAPFALVP